MKRKNIIICDIDGTVANNLHRQHFLTKKKDWHNFFNNLDKDQPILKIIEKINKLDGDGFEIIFITGRPEKYRFSTTAWLEKFFQFDIKILMRADKDRRNKVDIKKELFKKNFKSSKVYMVFENDDELCALWQSLGLKVFKVNESDFD